MLRNLVATTVSALVASAALAGPASAAEYDLATARSELAAAAAVTRTEAANGFSSTGTGTSYSDWRVGWVVDNSGHSRTMKYLEPAYEDRLSYAAVGVGEWVPLGEELYEQYAAGFAYIGKPNARHMFTPGSGEMPDSGAERAEHPERGDLGEFTLLSADKVDDGDGHITYTFAAHSGDSAWPTTITAELTDGLVTRFSTTTLIEGERTQRYDRRWEYGPQPLVVVPPPDRSVTTTEMVLSRSAVVLKATVKRHARQTAALAKTIAREQKHKRVRVRDVRAAAVRVLDKYVESGDYPEDGIPTRAVNLTRGVALHATDPYKSKVRISTVLVIKGKVIVS
jgi:hypothetical protein